VLVGDPVYPADHPDREALAQEVRSRVEALVAEANLV
jgi:hypothetical protein